MTSKADLNWAAGLFEGEGSIGIRNFTGRQYGCVVVAVTNTDRSVCDFFCSRWGGRLRPATGLRSSQRPAFVWVAYARVASAFLDAIRPYLRTVRVQTKADLALSFQAGKRFGKHCGPGYREQQLAYRTAMLQLNRRGVAKCRPNAADFRRSKKK